MMNRTQERALARCGLAKRAETDAERQVYEALSAARAAGLSWADIAGPWGTTRQALHQRWQRLNRRYGTGDQQRLT